MEIVTVTINDERRDWQGIKALWKRKRMVTDSQKHLKVEIETTWDCSKINDMQENKTQKTQTT